MREARRDAVIGWVLALCALVALCLAADARAAGEYEINDTRETAYGPLSGASDYTASFETDNDVDWYVFYLKVYSQMDIAVGNVAGCSGGEARVWLRDRDGKEVSFLFGGELNKVNHLRTTLAAGRYYLEVDNDGCIGDRYKLRIDPAAAVTPSRVCGEGIVARESVGPELAKVSEKIGYLNGVVERRTAKVRAAKQRLKRLKARRGASRYAKRSARRRLAAEQASLAKALEKKFAMDTLGAQYTAALNTANAQIAGSC